MRNCPLKKRQALHTEHAEKRQSPKVKEAIVMVTSRRIFGRASDVFKSKLVLDSEASDHMVNADALLFNIQPIPLRSIFIGKWTHCINLRHGGYENLHYSR